MIGDLLPLRLYTRLQALMASIRPLELLSVLSLVPRPRLRLSYMSPRRKYLDVVDLAYFKLI